MRLADPFRYADLVRVSDSEGNLNNIDVARYRTDLCDFVFVRDHDPCTHAPILHDPMYFMAVLLVYLHLDDQRFRLFVQNSAPCDGFEYLEFVYDENQDCMVLQAVPVPEVLDFLGRVVRGSPRIGARVMPKKRIPQGQ
jgi:hypothetical protein